jgi:hypothetical protein
MEGPCGGDVGEARSQAPRCVVEAVTTSSGEVCKDVKPGSDQQLQRGQLGARVQLCARSLVKLCGAGLDHGQHMPLDEQPPRRHLRTPSGEGRAEVTSAGERATAARADREGPRAC